MESVKSALRLFELVAAHGEIGVSELARLTEQPKSTVQRGLTTLYDAGWLRPAGVGGRRRWAPSARLMVLARGLDPAPRLQRSALGAMQDLRDATGETIHLMLRDGDEVVLIERLDSLKTLRTVRALGARAPLHVAANGKAVLANLPAEDQDRYLAGRLARWTPRTHTDSGDLRGELAQVRARGYAFSDGELDIEVRAVAAAILDADGQPLGSLSISCPATRLEPAQVEPYGQMLAEAARAISRRYAA
jgi:IclR family acetate operon transcriptional repressor